MYKPLTNVFHHSFKIEALSLDLKSVHAFLYIKVYPISVYSYTGNYHPERLTSVVKRTFSLIALDHHYQLVVIIVCNRKSSHRERRLLTVFIILVKTVVTTAVSSPEA